MHFDNFFDIQVQTFLLRILHSLFILGVSITLYKCARVVEDQGLTVIFWKSAGFSGAFFFCRIVAGVADSYYAFTIGWFSNVVNVIFWSIILYRVISLYRILASPRNNEERVALRQALGEIERSLRNAKENLKLLT